MNKYHILLAVTAELGTRQVASEGVEDEARRVLVTRPLDVTKKNGQYMLYLYQALDFVVE